ncbi:MAG TPA: MBL fold metallo-hydrolase [Porticoccaceae bacterium]|nr:MBL fold metallo-hydrolase [Gammaproteobacteria bacterium]HIL60318.1 MBL fold metallo-hydrolase [Porticoccaceae bacterium]
MIRKIAIIGVLVYSIASEAQTSSSSTVSFEGIRITMCGTSSPLPAPGRAQACVAVETPDHLYIVDAGSGSAATANLVGIPTGKLRGILLTHFHSDHISDIGDFNLNSWVAGRPAPLQIVGPEGVDRIVEGLNITYELDRAYRVAHHGAELLNPELGILQSRTINEGIIVDEDGLRITAFEVSHPPIDPAYGYRFDYGGRSVVISGDSLVTDKIVEISNGADVVLHDAMALQLVQGAENLARSTGNTRLATVLHDIQDYHATTRDLQRLVDEADIGQLALYHLVPAPRNAMAVAAFNRGIPDGAIITEDGMVISLSSDTEDMTIE